MKKYWPLVRGLLILLVIGTAFCYNYFSYSGYVYDDFSQPVSNVKVTGCGLYTYTDSKGYFKLDGYTLTSYCTLYFYHKDLVDFSYKTSGLVRNANYFIPRKRVSVYFNIPGSHYKQYSYDGGKTWLSCSSCSIAVGKPVIFSLKNAVEHLVSKEKVLYSPTYLSLSDFKPVVDYVGVYDENGNEISNAIIFPTPPFSVDFGSCFDLSVSAENYETFKRRYCYTNSYHPRILTVSLKKKILSLNINNTYAENVEYSYDGQTWNYCSNKICEVEPGEVYIRISGDNFVPEVFHSNFNSDSTINLNFKQAQFSFSISAWNENPILNPSVVVSQNVIQNGNNFIVNLDEPFSIQVSAPNYETFTKTYTFTEDYHPSTLAIKLHGEAHQIHLNILDNGSPLDANLEVKEGGTCSGSDGSYVCDVYMGENFVFSITKEGYISKEFTYKFSNPTEFQDIQINMEKTLFVNITDDYGLPVNGTLKIGDIEYNFSGNSFFAVPPGTYELTFYGENYSTISKEITIEDGKLNVVKLSTKRYWKTPINLYGPDNSLLLNYTIEGANCTNYVCLIGKEGASLTVSKPGYITKIVEVPSNNNGSPINVYTNTSVVFYGEGVVSVNDQVYNLNGYLYLPLTEGRYFGKYVSRNYKDREFYFDVSYLQPYFVNFSSEPIINMYLNITDYYTHEPINNYYVFAKHDGEVVSSTNPLKIDTTIQYINLTIGAPGYVETNFTNVNVSDSLNISLKPLAVLNLNVYSNITIEVNGENITKEGTFVSLPYENFKLYISSFGYEPEVLEYSNITKETIINVNLQKLTYGPVVDNYYYNYSDRNLNISIHAYDTVNISECIISTNGETWIVMEGDYNKNDIYASKVYENVAPGNYTFYVKCADKYTYGDTEEIKVSLSEPKEEEPQINESQVLEKYELAVASGLYNEKLASLYSTHNYTELNEMLPDVVVEKEVNANMIYINKDEIKSVVSFLTNKDIHLAMATKKLKYFKINGMPKTLITLEINSDKDLPDAYVFDYTVGNISSSNRIPFLDGYIIYFKGIKKGVNIFKYVVDGYVNETAMPYITEESRTIDLKYVWAGVLVLLVLAVFLKLRR